MTVTWAAINEALGDIPDLRGAEAKCVGRSDLFDVEDPDDPRAIAARNLCASCPAIQPCTNFASTLRGHRRPGGTLAGQTHAHRPVALARPKQPPKPKPIRPPKPRLDATQWLAGRLADGPAPAADVVAGGVKAELSASALDRARRRIGAVSERLPRRRGASQWRLEDPCAQQGTAQAGEQPSGAA